MKDVLMMILPDCPYCHQAMRMMEALRSEDARYAAVKVRVVNEQEGTALAESLDYYYVPTYFVGGQKLHEWVPTLEAVRRVFDAALAE